MKDKWAHIFYSHDLWNIIIMLKVLDFKLTSTTILKLVKLNTWHYILIHEKHWCLSDQKTWYKHNLNKREKKI